MNWFFASGDAPFFFSEQLQFLSFFPDMWRAEQGMGVSALPSLWIDYPFRLITFGLFRLGLSWFVIDKLWWCVVFLMAIVGSYKLARWWGLQKNGAFLSSLIYSTNTYILLLFDGGQLGVALAYSFVPFVFETVLALITVSEKQQSIKHTLKTGLFISILCFLDLRIAYVFFVLLCVVCLFMYGAKKMRLRKNVLFIPLIVLGINFFWILPSVMYPESLRSIVTSNIEGQLNLSFFSVADFTHAISLLHPNYPENLFGRIYFFKPEFLLIPLFAFGCLVSKKKHFLVYIFGCIALVGAFLGKGVQEPFGEIYSLAFSKIPGFVLFRDPTKWYILIIISYALLIPYTISKFSKFRLVTPLLLWFLLYWVFTLRFIFVNAVNGNVSPPYMTADYIHLKQVLLNDVTIGRTLWLPEVERFGYASTIHPALSAADVMTESSPSGIARMLTHTDALKQIVDTGVSYIVVPEDVERRMFLDDYQYKEELREALIMSLDTSGLDKLQDFSRLAVYKISTSSALFSIGAVPADAIDAGNDTWNITVPHRTEPTNLVVRMTYDPNWQFTLGSTHIRPTRVNKNQMQFPLDSGPEQKGDLIYLPTQAAKTGAIISWLTFFTTCAIWLYCSRRT